MDAKKPRFFSSGSTLREVDLETGALKLGTITQFEKGHVYQGGSKKIFSLLSGAKGPEVLYVGDHIFSDIMVSKKMHQWRNLLVVRELSVEIDTWSKIIPLYKHLLSLEFLLAETYRGLDSESKTAPNVEILRGKIKSAVKQLNENFNFTFGSLFKSGSKHSFFAMQVCYYFISYYCHFIIIIIIFLINIILLLLLLLLLLLFLRNILMLTWKIGAKIHRSIYF